MAMNQVLRRLAVLGAVLAAAAPGAPPAVAADARGSGPLTITPFQTATFVADPEAAALLDGLAEFSTQLLVWTDTPRGPVTAASRTVKGAFPPYIAQWRARGPSSSPPVSVVRARVSSAYRSLESPRLLRLAIGDTLAVTPPVRPPDAVAETPVELPVIVDNRRKSPVHVTLASGGRTLTEFTLLAGEATGRRLAVGASAGERALPLEVKIDAATQTVPIPLQRHAAGDLHVTVLDADGRPTAARVYLTAADGRAYAPVDAMQRFVTGDYAQPFAGEAYFYTGGDFRLALPAGRAVVEVVKGFSTPPVRREVLVAPRGETAVTLPFERAVGPAADGWYGGDTHVHANLFAQEAIAPRDVLRIAEAEDLDVVNLLPCNDPRTATITDRAHFRGGLDPVSTARTLIYYNEEMRNDLYGHVGFMGLTTFVEPAYFGWPHSPFPYDAPGNFPQTAAAHAQGAAVTYSHPGLPSEFPVDIALGLADTIDVMSQGDESVTAGYWYRLLNCGLRCPVSAGTDAFLNIPCHLIAGAARVYVHTGEEFTYAAWVDGYRRGHSYATNGPLLAFTVNGRGPGDEIAAESGPVRLTVHAAAHSHVPMSAAEIVVNGRVVHHLDAGPDAYRLEFTTAIEVPASAWVALRVTGPAHRLVTNDRTVYAHTSPVYVTVAGRPVVVARDARYLASQVDALIARTERDGHFADAASRNQVLARFREARARYLQLAADAP